MTHLPPESLRRQLQGERVRGAAAALRRCVCVMCIYIYMYIKHMYMYMMYAVCHTYVPHTPNLSTPPLSDLYTPNTHPIYYIYPNPNPHPSRDAEALVQDKRRTIASLMKVGWGIRRTCVCIYMYNICVCICVCIWY